jgi:hypothetical protein
MLQIEGKEDEAKDVLRRCADQGAPIPLDF